MANKLEQLRQMREQVRAPSHAVVAPVADLTPANPAAGASTARLGTYQYRDADSRRSYMANYMRGYRQRRKGT